MDTKIVEVLEEIKEVLTEASQHYPFKRKAKLGPGPRGRIHRKKDRWVCKCGGYECTCKGKGDAKGRTKTVAIDKAYKSEYNAQYKAWRKKHAKKAGKKKTSSSEKSLVNRILKAIKGKK